MTAAVVDTNVVVSAHINAHGAPARVLDLWREARYVLVVSESMLAEMGRMLAHPKLRRYGVTPADATDFLHAIRESACITPGLLTAGRATRDPKDDMVLAAALEGTADYIVTGDDDLLALGSYERIPILPPAVFVQLIEGQ